MEGEIPFTLSLSQHLGVFYLTLKNLTALFAMTQVCGAKIDFIRKN